mmetsp:Transcript_18497/g.59138  ORF Transcript_18497/g.59138 Transcript_18497/m.59138 type:complete len:146 (-) Transcript_18497:28-465(-)
MASTDRNKPRGGPRRRSCSMRRAAARAHRGEQDDILLKAEIDAAVAQHPDRLTARYVVSRAAEGQPLAEGVSVGRLDERLLRKHLPPSASADEPTRVLVCGPESLLRTLCGPRARDGPTPPGQRRAPLGGLLGELGYRSEEVFWL